MAQPNSDVKVTTAANGRDYKDRAANELCQIFRHDPVIRFLLSGMSDDRRLTYMNQYFHTLIKAAQLNDAVFQEANDWKTIAIWMPPGKRVDNYGTIIQAGFVACVLKIGPGGAKRMLVDYVGQVDKVKARQMKAQGVKRYWYLFFLGTVEEERGKGLGSHVVKEWQKLAAEEGLPIWLEATTEKSKSLYVKCGFEVLEVIWLGKGSHGADGQFQKDGPGVPIWAMVWRPPVKEVVNGNH